MIVQNKLNKSFGPAGSFSGIIVFVLGLISTYYSLYMLGLVIVLTRKKIMPLKKLKTLATAKEEIIKLQNDLGL